MMPRLTLIERFYQKVDQQPDGCHIWTGRKIRGYGVFDFKGGSQLAHRWIYEQKVGPIPEGYHLDHTCQNPPCVNPAHLQPVSPNEHPVLHARRRDFASTWQCAKGHPISERYVTKLGQWRCRICDSERRKAAHRQRMQDPAYRERRRLQAQKYRDTHPESNARNKARYHERHPGINAELTRRSRWRKKFSNDQVD